MLQKKSAVRYQTISQEKILEGISDSAHHWPKFGAFRFVSGVTIVIVSEDHKIKVVISTIGRVRQTPFEKK